METEIFMDHKISIIESVFIVTCSTSTYDKIIEIINIFDVEQIKCPMSLNWFTALTT